MNNSRPFVSIVVLNHNGMKHLKSCLESLMKTNYPEFEIILVDNGSDDLSVSFVRRNYPKVKLLELGKNYGSSVGYMAGVKIAQGPYVSILNNDIEVDPDWLYPLVEALEKNPTVAAADPKFKNYFDRKRFEDSAAAGRLIDYFGNNYTRGVNEVDRGQFDQIEYIMGVLTFFRKSTMIEIGGFDTSFGYGYEDIDLGWRFYLSGYKVMYVPKSVIYHKSGATSRMAKNRKIRPNLYYLIKRNRLIALLKNYGIRNMLVALFVSSFEYFLTLYYFMLNRERLHSLAIVKAMLYILPNLRLIFVQRSKVQQLRRLADKEIKRHMVRYSGDIRWLLSDLNRGKQISRLRFDH
jgi:GT2 family glycosyltransferase